MYLLNPENLRSGQDFIPVASLRSFAGFTDSWQAEHKMHPDHFIVTEKQPGLQLSASIESDLPPSTLLMTTDKRYRYVAVTLVKTRHTTPAAIDLIAKRLNIRSKQVTYAGLKDRTAVTAQRIVIEGVDFETVKEHCTPSENELNNLGYFLKDPLPSKKKLSRGHLEGNKFQILLTVANKISTELREYLIPRVNYLLTEQINAPWVPNFFGRQRLGRRQNLMGVGFTLITEGLDAGVKRFITECVEENDHPKATELRKKLLEIWERAEAVAKVKGGSIADQHFDFMDMRKLLEARTGYRGQEIYKTANMFIEWRLIKKILNRRSIEKAVIELKNDLSLSIGAYQGFWFNQVLGRVIDGEIPVEALEVNRNHNPVIPLYFPSDPSSVAFYQKWCPEAIPATVDEKVLKIFLVNYPDRPGPKRPAFMSVKGLQYNISNGKVNFEFTLPSGSFATIFLSYLFDLDKISLMGGEATSLTDTAAILE
jgi:TruD family tRNA pseudouridine synthase